MTSPAAYTESTRRASQVAAIEVCGLSKEFGRVPVLQGLDFTVPRGGVCAVLGSAGTGKTTLLQILAGRLRPSCGEALVCGIDVAADAARSARRIGLLQQPSRFFGWMTGREGLQYAGRFCSLSGARTDRRVDDLLELVGLSTAGKQRIDQYRPGMRQRLGIAMALVGAPEVLLLDEPAAALEAAEREDVLHTIERLRGWLTILFASRNVQDAVGLASVTVRLERGRTEALRLSGALVAGAKARP